MSSIAGAASRAVAVLLGGKADDDGAARGGGGGEEGHPPPPPPPPPPVLTTTGAAPQTALKARVTAGVHLQPTATRVRNRDGSVTVERAENLTATDSAALQDDKVPAWLLDKGGEGGEASETGRVPPPLDLQRVPDVAAQADDAFSRTGGEWELWGDAAAAAGQHRRELFAWRFEAGAGEWQRAVSGSLGVAKLADHSLRVTTFNVWFDGFAWERRLDALLDIVIREEDSDVICLQEMTPRALQHLLRNEVVRERYYVNDIVGATVAPYGVLTLVARRLECVPRFREYSLPTGMNRRGLELSFLTGSGSAARLCAICNVHLESLGSWPTRTKQLKILHAALAAADCGVLCGDFNITATGPYGNPAENRQLSQNLPGMHDLWLHMTDGMAPNDAGGETFDTVKNTMLGGGREQSRYDRVMARGFECKEIRIIGDSAVGAENRRDIFPSDHFGLTAVLRSFMPSGMFMP